MRLFVMGPSGPGTGVLDDNGRIGGSRHNLKIED